MVFDNCRISSCSLLQEVKPLTVQSSRRMISLILSPIRIILTPGTQNISALKAGKERIVHSPLRYCAGRNRTECACLRSRLWVCACECVRARVCVCSESASRVFTPNSKCTLGRTEGLYPCWSLYLLFSVKHWHNKKKKCHSGGHALKCIDYSLVNKV